MTQPPARPVVAPIASYAYRGQDRDGQPMSGTIDASTLDDATRRLQSLGVRISSIEPVHPPAAARPLRAADFLAFNEQLAQLTTSGLPVEHGLKLIAQDLRGDRLAAVVRELADELERGTSLADALAQHRNQFPPLYARLVDAGIRSNSLSGLLLNLGAHLDMVRRLRAALWRATSYPLMVLLGLMIVLLFLSRVVLPQFNAMYGMFHINGPPLTWRWPPPPAQPVPTMPLITRILFAVGNVTPFIVITIIALFLVLPLIGRSLYYRGSGTAEWLTLKIPLIGPILRLSLLARWCDIARLGVTAGLDLPAAIRLASDSISSPGLSRDADAMIGDLEAGRPCDATERRMLLPLMVPAAIEMASRTNNLPNALASLSDVYRRQAETRLDNMPTILTPVLLLLMAISIGCVILGLMLPVLNFIRYVSGGML